MAGYCAGVTVSFRGVSIGEPTDIKATTGGNLPVGRGSAFAVDAGSVEVSSLSTAAGGANSSTYGLKGTLSISGGGVAFTTKAIHQSFDIAGKVNDVWRFRNVFRIVQE